MLFCQAMEGHARGNDIFNLVDNFFNDNNLSWNNCVGVCTDGAGAMIGNRIWLKAKVLNVAPHVTFTHCIIHRENLAAKNLRPEVNAVLNDAIQIVNFIKSQPLKSRDRKSVV